MKDICEAPWEYNAVENPFASPQQYFKDWLHEFNISILDKNGAMPGDEPMY